jgi:hypothetical protein
VIGPFRMVTRMKFTPVSSAKNQKKAEREAAFWLAGCPAFAICYMAGLGASVATFIISGIAYIGAILFLQKHRGSPPPKPTNKNKTSGTTTIRARDGRS